jgi:hypothetical protein
MRRKILLVFAITLYCVGSAKSQIGKGSILAGGNFGYSTQNIAAGLKENTLTIYPSLGIAIADNTILGTSFRYGLYDIKGSSVARKNYGGGIFLRKYKP